MLVLGELALWVALLMAAWAAAVSVAGGALCHPALVSSGERAAYVTLASLAAAALGLAAALLRSEFALAYVAAVTSANLPSAYKLTAFWAGAAGSRLLSALLLAACAVAALVTNRQRRRPLAPFATAALSALAFGALLAVCLGTNPYARLDWLPPEGRGLDPQLQHPGAALFPPLLALGFAAGAVPLAHVAAALVARRADRDWLRVARRWGLASWLCLTIGLLTAAWSAYAELGSGNGARWDSAAVLGIAAWLTTTGYLHGGRSSFGRAPLSSARVALVVAAGWLCLVGAFLPARSGAHAAAPRPPREALSAGALLVAAAVGSAYLLVGRRAGLSAVGRAFRRATPRRRYGGHVVHCGVALLAAGAAGLAARRDFVATLHPGAGVDAVDAFGRRWEFVSQGVSSEQIANRDATVVAVRARRDGERVDYLRSERRRHFDSRGAPTAPPAAQVGIIGSPVQDVRAVLLGVGADESAQFRISFVPLVRWIWIGGAVMVLGAVIAILTPAAPPEVSP